MKRFILVLIFSFGFAIGAAPPSDPGSCFGECSYLGEPFGLICDFRPTYQWHPCIERYIGGIRVCWTDWGTWCL